ncbi:MAG: 2-C-methyl-D-erythritol 4-phosphate cytidylyltransferase [Actinomycetota bacterium]|nr:2-C-methyl-D-erythritol 4-phosphate cytidylyltransferase [Actinomycetota bacterium]
MSVWAVLLAAGRGQRLGPGLAKQWLDVDGRRAVDRVVVTATSVVDGTVLVLPPDVGWDGPPVSAVAAGGATRAQSVRGGLALVPEGADVVVVHDAAHPLASAALLERVVHRVRAGADAAVCVVPMTEVVQVVRDGRIVAVLPPGDLVSADQEKTCPSAGSHLSAHREDPVSAVTRVTGSRKKRVTASRTRVHRPASGWCRLTSTTSRSAHGPRRTA